MSAIIWKDIAILKRSKGLFVFSVIIGFIIALFSMISREIFQHSFSNLILLLPLVVGFDLNSKIFCMEIQERSIEGILATHFSVRKIILTKVALLTLVSIFLGWIVLFLSTIFSWILYNDVVLPPRESLLIFPLAILFIFSINGLVGAAYWFFSSPTMASLVNTGVFIVAVLFLNLSPLFMSYSINLLAIMISILSLILIGLFFVIVRGVNKEKVALARL